MHWGDRQSQVICSAAWVPHVGSDGPSNSVRVSWNGLSCSGYVSKDSPITAPSRARNDLRGVTNIMPTFSKPSLNLRFLALTLAFVFGVATGALGVSVVGSAPQCSHHHAGLNALVQAQDEQDDINTNLPEQPCEIFALVPCTGVNIDVHGTFRRPKK